jgi:alkanesulfonate monooxygenase SsuD/methylene tetrahydromethanopterin reductase-like flavin-dependent oxidoreductase (luciferase family)
MGMRSFVFVADSDDAALAIARRAYKMWFSGFIKLWDEHNARPINANFAPTFDGVLATGEGIAGSPDTVRKTLAELTEAGGVNYLVCRFAFGDLTEAEASRSVDLFVREVMPALSGIGE